MGVVEQDYSAIPPFSSTKLLSYAICLRNGAYEKRLPIIISKAREKAKVTRFAQSHQEDRRNERHLVTEMTRF